MKNTFQKLQQNWRMLADDRGQFKTADERYFCKRYTARVENDLQDISLPIGIAYNFCSAGIIPLVGKMDQTTIFLVIMHIIVGIASIIPFVKSSLQSVMRTYLSPSLLTVAPLSYLSATAVYIQNNNSSGTLLMGCIALAVSVFAILMSPAKSFFYIPLTLVISGFSVFATFNHPFAFSLSVIFVLSNFATLAFRRMQHKRQLLMARHEFAILIQAAPANIIRHSVESEQSVAELFAPQEFRCVCLSSDWRGYQSLSAEKSAESLSTALGEYYESCGELLAKWFPEGNYFADWIADELFVVAYTKDEEIHHQLVQKMILMANELFHAKENFQKKYGFPEAIDVGISSGPSLIGMMGPSWHKKATALGEVPGQSRRYQSAGKLLRLEHGESDRIIFGPETLLSIRVPLEISEFLISESKKLRDISSPSIYYIDGTYASHETFQKNLQLSG
jgi:hypothetical protein